MHHGYIYTNRFRGQSSYCEEIYEYHGRLTIINGIITKENLHTHAPDTTPTMVQMDLIEILSNVCDNKFYLKTLDNVTYFSASLIPYLLKVLIYWWRQLTNSYFLRVPGWNILLQTGR